MALAINHTFAKVQLDADIKAGKYGNIRLFQYVALLVTALGGAGPFGGDRVSTWHRASRAVWQRSLRPLEAHK